MLLCAAVGTASLQLLSEVSMVCASSGNMLKSESAELNQCALNYYYYSSSIDSTTLGVSRSVQQFYSTPVCPLPSPSNQQFSSSLGLLIPGPSTLTWVSLLVLCTKLAGKKKLLGFQVTYLCPPPRPPKSMLQFFYLINFIVPR